jgi:16S rRNA (adenine1518-N6/adenine1519-N6)-dimethyltransferase
MDLTSPRVIKNLLKRYGVAPLKRLGQNFLIDEFVLRKIIEAAHLSPKDVVLEIGSGIGTLTQELAKRVKKVIAVEKDKKMIEILKETLKDFKNAEVIQDDILKIKNLKLKIKNYRVVANLPYYIVSPVIRRFLESDRPPKEMILMVQKEVAQRICAKPPDMSILAVSVQFYAKPEILFYVSKNSFWPRPKVDGAVIKITPNSPLVFSTIVENTSTKNLFFKIVRAGFSQPRKQIANNLSKVLKLDKEKIKYWLKRNNISYSQRAETLAIKDWLKLTKNWYKI